MNDSLGRRKVKRCWCFILFLSLLACSDCEVNAETYICLYVLTSILSPRWIQNRIEPDECSQTCASWIQSKLSKKLQLIPLPRLSLYSICLSVYILFTKSTFNNFSKAIKSSRQYRIIWLAINSLVNWFTVLQRLWRLINTFVFQFSCKHRVQSVILMQFEDLISSFW